LSIRAEQGTAIPANGDSLCYAVVKITDAGGNLIPYAEDKLTATYTGNGTLLAFGSARPTTEENYTAGETTAYKGRALAVIRATEKPGEGCLKIISESFGEVNLSIRFTALGR